MKEFFARVAAARMYSYGIEVRFCRVRSVVNWERDGQERSIKAYGVVISVMRTGDSALMVPIPYICIILEYDALIMIRSTIYSQVRL